MSFSYNLLNCSLSHGFLIPVPSTFPTYYMYTLNTNGVDWFPPCLPIMFPFLFTSSPKCGPLLRLVDCSWSPLFKLNSYPCRYMVVGVYESDILFFSGLCILSVALEVLLSYFNYNLTGLPSLDPLIFFPSWIHCIWFLCYFLCFLFKLML